MAHEKSPSAMPSTINLQRPALRFILSSTHQEAQDPNQHRENWFQEMDLGVPLIALDSNDRQQFGVSFPVLIGLDQGTSELTRTECRKSSSKAMMSGTAW